MESASKILMVVGALLFISGAIIYSILRTGFQPGLFSGDIRIETGSSTCMIAVGASMVLSILLTILLNIFIRFFK
jgi:hypothetical protein